MRIRILAADRSSPCCTRLTACGSARVTPTARLDSDGDTVTLVTHDSFAVSKSVLRDVHEADRRHGEGPEERRRRRRAQPGHPHQGRPARRRVLRRRQHVPRRARSTAGIFVPYTAKGLDRVPAALQLDDRNRVTPIDYGDVCVNYDKAVVRATSSSRCRRRSTTSRTRSTRTSSSSRTRPRRHPASRSCSRRWRSTAPTAGRLLEAAARQRREGRRRLGGGVQRPSSRPGPARATTRSSSATRRARRPRCIYADPRPKTAPTGVAHRHLLPPGRVRRRAEGRGASGGGRSA